MFHLYGLLIGLGIVAAVEVSNWWAKRKKWPAWVVDRAVVGVVLGVS